MTLFRTLSPRSVRPTTKRQTRFRGRLQQTPGPNKPDGYVDESWNCFSRRLRQLRTRDGLKRTGEIYSATVNNVVFSPGEARFLSEGSRVWFENAVPSGVRTPISRASFSIDANFGDGFDYDIPDTNFNPPRFPDFNGDGVSPGTLPSEGGGGLTALASNRVEPSPDGDRSTGSSGPGAQMPPLPISPFGSSWYSGVFVYDKGYNSAGDTWLGVNDKDGMKTSIIVEAEAGIEITEKVSFDPSEDAKAYLTVSYSPISGGKTTGSANLTTVEEVYVTVNAGADGAINGLYYNNNQQQAAVIIKVTTLDYLGNPSGSPYYVRIRIPVRSYSEKPLGVGFRGAWTGGYGPAYGVPGYRVQPLGVLVTWGKDNAISDLSDSDIDGLM